MALTCPRCRRRLADSADPAAAPAFCMFCGQKLRPGPPPGPPAPAPADSADSADTTHAYAPPADDPPNGTVAAPAGFHRVDLPPADAPVRAVGGYRLVKKIGAGGMGAVYQAEHLATGRPAAVKLLDGRLAANPLSVDRFRQEGRVASQIAHPHCVFVLGADAEAGRPYIVMELMPGRTLKDLVDEQGPLPVPEAVDRILDVAAGLAEAHRLGVIHRDIKPSNCLLTPDGRVKVGDFGLSKSLAADRPAGQKTQSGAFLGTVLFASPEQIRGEPVGYESDVYAACGTLYFLLTGRAPYQHDSLTAALARAVSEPPPPIRARRPDVPAEVEKVVLRGLERDRARRWQSAAELGDALRELLPANQRPASRRALAGAYLVDATILQVVMAPVEVARQVTAGGLAAADVLDTWPTAAATVLYFGLFEGRLGWTPGKRLLRLRVARVGEAGPPGVGRALARAVVFNALWYAVFLLPEAADRWPGGPAGAAVGAVGALSALAVLAYQLWPTKDGFRGVHDFATRTRTVQRPRPPHRPRLVGRGPNPLDAPQPGPVPLPAAVGGFAVQGKVGDLPDGGEVWVGADKGLGRRVLVWVLPAGAAPPADAADPVARPTRLRAVGHGTVRWRGADRAWVGYVAPAGAPLAAVAGPGRPLDWADARPILEQVAAEVDADEAGGRLSVDHVWVEPGGRVQVLPFPIPCDLAGGGEQGADAPRPPAADPLAVVRRVATLALEGAPRAAGGPVRAPLPPHASQITDKLFGGGYKTVAGLRADLADNHAHPARVTAGMRAAHLGLQASLLAPGLAVMLALAGGFGLLLAAAHGFRMRAAEEARAAVADPARRAEVVAAAGDLPADARARVEADLSPARAGDTAARLDALVARRRAEADPYRAALTRPERAAVGRFVQAAPLPGGLGDSAGLVDAALREADGGKPAPAPAEVRARAARDVTKAVVLWPAVWAGFAFAFRGGLGMTLAGIALVRADGRRASRARCAVRELLVWGPVTGVLLGCLWVQAAAPGLVAARVVLFGAAALMLPGYVLIALRDPVRPPQDRIAGTYLVPA